MAYIDQMTLARDATFRDRVTVAGVRMAGQTMGEAQGGQSDTVYGKRQAFAAKVLADPQAWAVQLTLLILSLDLTITSAIDDATLQTRVSQAFNKLAFVTGKD